MLKSALAWLSVALALAVAPAGAQVNPNPISGLPVATSVNPQTDYGVGIVQRLNGAGLPYFATVRVPLGALVGPAGPVNTLNIGTVTTLPAGSSAAASITGTSPNQLLNLSLPAGQNGTGTGSVTSVGLALPSALFTVSGPVTTSGTLTGTFAAQPPNTVLAGPASGATAASPTMRTLVAADLPASGATAGSYVLPIITLDTYGRLTVASNGTLSGDVTTSAGSLATTISAGAVTNAKMAQMPASTIKANPGGSAATPSDISTSQAKTLLGFASSGANADITSLASPALGAATATTQPANDSSTKVATTAQVQSAIALTAGAAYPMTGVVAKSAAYTIQTSDKGAMFDITGSIALTLPAASGGTTSAPLYFHFRKRDGSGRATVVPNGTDTIEGANTAIALYQERATLVSFGSGWVFPPGGRDKVVDVVLPTAFSAASTIALLTGFDADVKDVEIELVSVTTSVDLNGLTMQFYRGTSYVTSAYFYSGLDFNGSSSPTATVTSSTNDSALYLGGASARTTNAPISATVTVRNVQAAGGKGPTVESRGTAVISGASGGSWTSRGYQGNGNTATAINGLKIYGLGAGATITGTYSQRITRQ